MIAKIGAAEVAVMFVALAVALAGFVALVALGVRIGTRGPRQRN